MAERLFLSGGELVILFGGGACQANIATDRCSHVQEGELQEAPADVQLSHQKAARDARLRLRLRYALTSMRVAWEDYQGDARLNFTDVTVVASRFVASRHLRMCLHRLEAVRRECSAAGVADT